MERTARQGESHDKARQGNVFKGRRQLGVEKICIVDFFFLAQEAAGAARQVLGQIGWRAGLCR